MKHIFFHIVALAALLAGTTAHACTSWVIHPSRSASGKMIVHICRDSSPSPLDAEMYVFPDGRRYMWIGTTSGWNCFSMNYRGVVAILNATAAELLPRQALAMHGTADVLEGRGAAGEFAESLKPLAARIDAFAANPGAGIDDAELAGIRADIARMKAAVESVRREGIPSGGGRMMVAKDILKGIDLLLENAGKTFEHAKASVADAVRRNMLGTVEGLLHLDASRRAKLEDS